MSSADSNTSIEGSNATEAPTVKLELLAPDFAPVEPPRTDNKAATSAPFAPAGALEGPATLHPSVRIVPSPIADPPFLVATPNAPPAMTPNVASPVDFFPSDTFSSSTTVEEAEEPAGSDKTGSSGIGPVTAVGISLAAVGFVLLVGTLIHRRRQAQKKRKAPKSIFTNLAPGGMMT